MPSAKKVVKAPAKKKAVPMKPIKKAVKKAAPIKNSAKKALAAKPVKKAVKKPAPIKNGAKKAPPAKPVKKVAPVKKAAKKAAPIKNSAKKALAAKPVKKALAAKPVKKALAAKPVKKALAAKPVKKALAAKPVKKALAAKPVKKALAAKPVKKFLPAKAATPVVTAVTPAAPARLVMLPSSRPTKRKGGPQLKPLRHIPTPLVVVAGDEPWTKAELNAIKRDLQTDLDRLRLELANAEVEIADLLKDSGDGAGDDQADAGTKTFEREHELSLVNNERDMVLQSERALARIEIGTYGICESCGNPIGKARLQVFPRATLCMVCKQREERR